MASDRREYEDDGRFRRPDERDDDEPRPRRLSGVGIFSIISAAVALLLSPVPYLNWFAGVGAVVSLAFGLIGVVWASNSQGRVGGKVPIVGSILGVLALIASGLMIVVYLWRPVPLPAALRPPPPVTPSDPVAVTLTADELCDECEQNPRAAQANYSQQVIELTGVVSQVSGGTVYLKGRVFLSCSFGTGQQAVLDKLGPGNVVTIRGRFDYTRRTVRLYDCLLMPRGSPAGAGGPVTAAALVQTFADDAAGAVAAYKGKTMEVSGTVGLIDRLPGGSVSVVFTPAGGSVECRFAPKDAPSPAGLRAGQKVTIHGQCTGGEVGLVTLDGCSLVK